jgi:hypothetical protein
LEQIGKFGIPSLDLQGKKKSPFSWNLDKKFYINYKSIGSIRTSGLIFTGGFINSTKWCFCKLHYDLKWNFEWLMT